MRVAQLIHVNVFHLDTPRGRGFPRTAISRGDLFRSRPPNTSRPPSLHVDDFLAMESGGSSNYNKRDIIQVTPRGRGRGRGGFISRGAGSTAPWPRFVCLSLFSKFSNFN